MLDVSRRQVARAVGLAADTRADVETESHVEIGAPIEVLSSEARRAQLCGRRPRSTRSWRRSSSGTRPRRAPVSHGVLHGAHCPVAVVRPGTDG
jgi:hypothetical protein